MHPNRFTSKIDLAYAPCPARTTPTTQECFKAHRSQKLNELLPEKLLYLFISLTKEKVKGRTSAS